MIHKWQKKAFEEYELHFIHASDEWYLLAGQELPEEESYDGYLQLEIGVGMLRLFMNEFEDGLCQLSEKQQGRSRGSLSQELSLLEESLLTF